MDITQFNLIRPLSSPQHDAVLKLTEQRAIMPHPDLAANCDTRVPPTSSAAGVTLSLNTVPDAIGSAFDNPLRRDNALEVASPLQKTYILLNRLNDWLSARHDRVSGKDLLSGVASLLQNTKGAGMAWATGAFANADGSVLFQIALLGLYKALLEAMDPDKNFSGAEKLTRLALISDLLNRSQQALNALSPEAVFGLLNRRPVVLDGMNSERVAPDAKIKLIREAKVADLQVVRREWTSFVPSEIANIRNLMVGESFKQTDKTTSETETTSTTETQQSTQTQQETQTKLNSELSQQISTQLGITVNGHFDASASFNYPMVTANVSAGIDASLSIQRSESHASKIAREAISRAVSQIDSMTRESRTRRELMRTEQGFEYSLNNSAGKNVHAVYRWVDRIDTYQVFRYTDRLLLEFQIPEPAEYYRWRTKRHTNAANKVDLPPEWALKKEDIFEDSLIKLAAYYRASNLPAPPDKSLSVTATLTVQIGPESLPADEKPVTWNLTPASKDVDITIPPNYVATKAFYTGEGYPIRGMWRHRNGNSLEGYHAALVTVCVGKQSAVFWNGGITGAKAKTDLVYLATYGDNNDIGSVETIQINDPEPPYGRALLPIGKDGSLLPRPVEVDIAEGDPAIAGVAYTLKVSVTSIGLASCALTFLVQCERTQQAHSEWQLSVYDALYAAWAQWTKDYQNNQTRQALLGSTASDAGSSQRNQQIVREELKREVISWLLDEEHFKGRPGLFARPKNADDIETSFGDIEFDKARLDAPTIQFMEQAFDWTNLTYVFYPYFWADRQKDWDDLSQITANDPEFERFLRAGSSRVIVPARPGFESAVQNWLVYKIPFLSGQLPAINEPLYVSIDKEIREITAPWQGGVAGDWWQSRVSTTFLYLEQQGDLPFKNLETQLPAEQGIPFKPKIY